jgi:flagellar hook-associated protein 1
MSTGILGIALSGLAAFQRSLETTSNNISNVNTEGYSRQRVELSTRREEYTGAGYVGTGVNIANITRSYDQFITGQMRSSTSAFQEVDTYHTLASQIDNMIADEKTGLSPAMKSFFDAVNDVANDPTSIPARQAMLSEADSMTQRFNTVATRFDELHKQVDDNLGASVNNLNGFAKSIADLNTKIVADIGRASGLRMPNDLLDQRDLLLNKIAETVDVSVVPQPDGAVSVFIGQGQPLVLGSYASTLVVQGSQIDPSRKEILLNGQNITPQLSGGELYGNLRFRDEVLDPAQRQLGALAAGFSLQFNAVHKQGFDLTGTAGVAMFSLDAGGGIPVSGGPTGVVTATYRAPAAGESLQASDYLYDATTSTLTRLSDNATVNAVDEGFNLNTGGAIAGEKYLIRPAYYAAQNIAAQIINPRQIAAATVSTAIPGDNRNALALAGLETQSLLQNGKSTFSQVYGQLVADVGSKTHSALVSSSAQDVLLKQATSARENLAGVNLDEEAANLIKFQNSYQAAAQTVTVAKSLFDTLIGAVR